MYPWRNSFKSWADRTGLEIDALGLVTILGSEEMDRCIGRLVPSAYFDYLPLLGAFVISGKAFAKYQPGSTTMYNASAGIKTTMLAGWFSRWLKCQSLHQARTKITWKVEKRPLQWTPTIVGFFLIGLPFNGMLIALTVLAGDWWGLVNAMAMVLSVVVRCVLVAQKRAGIDEVIFEAEAQTLNATPTAAPSKEPEAPAETPLEKSVENHVKWPAEDSAIVLIVTDVEKAVHMEAPPYLIRPLFVADCGVPNERAYELFRCIGWFAFGVHIISIGMAVLATQIYTVVLLVVATFLTAHQIGCDDSHVWASWRSLWGHVNEEESYDCWVSSYLKATVSVYPGSYTKWDENNPPAMTPQAQVEEKGKPVAGRRKWLWQRKPVPDMESNHLPMEVKEYIPEKRQDLFAWMGLSDNQDEIFVNWGLMPRNDKWIAVYKHHKDWHRRVHLRNDSHGNGVKGKERDNE